MIIDPEPDDDQLLFARQPGLNPAHIQQLLIQTVVNELTGNGKCPSTGQSTARTSWVMDQMLRG